MNGAILHSETYRERFSPLFDFSEKDEIFSLIKIEKNSQEISLFNRVFKVDTLKQNQLHFKHLFQKWRENLDQSLEEVRYDTENLKSLQTLFQSLWDENKFFIIKERLKENELYSNKVKIAFKQFKNRVIRTLNTLSPEEISYRTKGLGFFSPPSVRNYSGLLLGLKSVNMLSPGFIFEKEKDERETCDVTMEDYHREAKLFSPSWGLNWEEKLYDAFKKLKNRKDTICFARTLDQIQVLSLINCFYEDCDHQLKLASLILALKGEVFLAVAISLSEKIHSLNHLLLELKNSDPQYVDELLVSLRENFIYSCNSMKIRIDIYCKKFRKDVKGHKISYKDIQEIEELLAKLRIIIEAIQATKILLHDVILHPETKHIFLVDLQKDYQRFVTRLTEKSTLEEHGGSIFPIIYRNVFERVELEDEEPAFEMLANWSLCHPSEYFEHGIYGDIALEELDLESKESKTHLFIIAKKNLEFLGLETILDLKKHNIFNRCMLLEFIEKRKVQGELKALTKSQLHGK